MEAAVSSFRSKATELVWLHKPMNNLTLGVSGQQHPPNGKSLSDADSKQCTYLTSQIKANLVNKYTSSRVLKMGTSKV